MEKLIDIQSGPVASLLDLLLKDKSTKKNIIWATDTYEELGHGFTDKEPISRGLLLQHADIIKPRIQKSQEAQQERTRKKAEVFTPAWLCNLMNNYCDEEWFGRKDIFNAENDDHTWMVADELIAFPKRKNWKQYVDSRRLEITCGEAPYLVSRYDVSTGQLIVPPKRRIGQLDRKLRIVNENAADYDEWVKWTIRAFEATYGYEYQGDNLLIARINLLLTFIDYYQERWDKNPDGKLLQTVANKIVWNIWQMDGLKDTVPLGKPYEEYPQMTLADFIPGMADLANDEPEAIPCKIYDWRRDNSILFNKLREMKVMEHKLFNFVIGNPPFQEDTKDTSDKPVYNNFMDAAYGVANKVELITPARFLFNAGKTPKLWNEERLSDSHFKVLEYVQDSSRVFSNTDIKGGVAVTYRDVSKDYGAIGTYSAFEELNSVLRKVTPKLTSGILTDIMILQNRFDLDVLYSDYPEAKEQISSDGREKRIVTSSFNKLNMFRESKPDEESIRVLGLSQPGNKRIYKWILRKYVLDNGNLEKYKVVLPKSNGSGAIGEVLSTPLVGEPLVGYTQSFIGIGAFNTEAEANACLKYVKSKFARAMLGLLKITQDNPPEKWKYVPLQDFTSTSDIDWSKSIHEIDLQLYRKYGLDEKEIAFIESHVKEMA
ncbi:Eco57I restriction-modification methylase domain-containing protein [Caproicibacterium argilliputei]|uniref:Eco57I restriction-modification methylase domain-containing protein n=1 Tax=Caproicibacterium argilliputei TaxID=3030016 RepID=A0AA97D818_9FIRM|nr:Eco57I restriction-modification methylase domain-containing protein [Caproicibacterium argilliputei]WOC31946.1 Eco57I restriction-modification methylase domain-containing protein [Caproicibacterium argilliputei]